MQAAVFATILLLYPFVASAQQGIQQQGVDAATVALNQQQKPNVPQPVQAVEEAVEDAIERFRIGVFGGVGLDPEIIVFGAQGTFAPIFREDVEFRPGLEFGVGEVTTMVALHFDFLYTLPGATANTRWIPYLGVGPNFSVSHRGFDTEGEAEVEERNRFDFSDTEVDGGLNVVAGVRNRNGLFLELKATAYGVTNIRLLAGYNF